jgi:hypothetical protein
MTAPPEIIALDDKGGPTLMTCAEWVLIERYIGDNGLDSWSQWSQNDRVTVARAFQKAYCYPRVSSDAVAKIMEMRKKSRAEV